jgi:hypothetical protein
MVTDGTVIIPLMLVVAVIVWLRFDAPRNGKGLQ